MLKYFYTLFFVTVMGTSFAQDFNYAVMNRKNIVHGLGYSRVINPNLILTSNLELLFVVGGGEGIRLVKQGGVSFGGEYIFLNRNKWKTVTVLNLTNRYDDVPGYKNLSFSSNLGVIGGYYTPKWFFAGEIGMFTPIISKLKFDRVHYVSPASNNYNDGWQRVNNIKFRYGLQLGYTIKKRADIILSYGVNTKQKSFGRDIKNSIYLDITINYRFGKLIENMTQEE